MAHYLTVHFCRFCHYIKNLLGCSLLKLYTLSLSPGCLTPTIASKALSHGNLKLRIHQDSSSSLRPSMPSL